MWTQAAAIAVIAAAPLVVGPEHSFAWWVAGAVLLGIGTAMVYPTLLAAVGDAAEPAWRAPAVGVYRFWRDLGYAVGAVLAGLVADLYDLHAAVFAVAAITFVSGVIVAARMREARTKESKT
jgi:MFS family permease